MCSTSCRRKYEGERMKKRRPDSRFRENKKDDGTFRSELSIFKQAESTKVGKPELLITTHTCSVRCHSIITCRILTIRFDVGKWSAGGKFNIRCGVFRVPFSWPDLQDRTCKRNPLWIDHSPQCPCRSVVLCTSTVVTHRKPLRHI